MGPDADLVQPQTDLTVAEWTPWLSSGEKPRGVVRSADRGLATSGRDEFADQGTERHRKDDGRGSEGDRDGLASEVDVLDGEFTDGGDLLRVEDKQQSSDSVRGGQRVVVEEASCVRPAFLAVDGALWAGPADGAAGKAVGMAVLYGPADEVAGLVAVAEGGIGHPAFQVGLCADPKGETFAGEPGEEVVGGVDVAAKSPHRSGRHDRVAGP